MADETGNDAGMNEPGDRSGERGADEEGLGGELRGASGAGGEMPRPPTDGDGSVMPSVDQAIERAVTELVDDVVEHASAAISDEGAMREILAGVVRETLQELAEREARRQLVVGATVSPMIGEAAQAGIGVARQVQDLGFVQFTAGLINGTFDAIIGATVRQMDAYAKLVADVAKTLAQFQAENVPPARVTAHLADRYPDGQGGTLVRPDVDIADTPADTVNGTPGKTGNQKLQEIVGALIVETSALPEADRLTRTSIGIAETDTATKRFTSSQVVTVRNAIAKTIATSMMDHLRAMVREGMARIVVTNGKILTKLTFNVTATEEDRKHQSNYHRDSAGAYIRGGAWAPWGSVQAGGNWNQLNVRTSNETNFDALTMSAEMIGQVDLNFKTETFAAPTMA